MMYTDCVNLIFSGYRTAIVDSDRVTGGVRDDRGHEIPEIGESRSRNATSFRTKTAFDSEHLPTGWISQRPRILAMLLNMG